MRLRNAARSVISGSRAAFSMTVVPLASTAAVMRFSVAPTLGNSSTMPRAVQQRRARACDEAVRDLDLGAHRLEPAEVHVDLAAADVVAAGQRDPRLAAAREQRAEHVERRAHARDELVRRLGRELAATRRSRTTSGAGPVDARADGAQQVDHHVEVARPAACCAAW